MGSCSSITTSGPIAGIGSAVAPRPPCSKEPSPHETVDESVNTFAKLDSLAHLHLDSSLTAEPFYAAFGYQAEERGEHVLWSGARMAAVKMRKDFPLDRSSTTI